MHEHWRNLELSKKLGYVWTVLFAILVLGTAGSILVPVYLDYLEETKAAAEERMKEEAVPSEASPQAEPGTQSRGQASLPGLALSRETPDGTLRVHRSAPAAGGLSAAPRVG